MTALSVSGTVSGATRLLGWLFRKGALDPTFGLAVLCWLGTVSVSAKVLVAGNPLQGSDAPSQHGIPAATPGELGYSVSRWTVEDGLPGRIITSLAQTPDGYLWCGTSYGLARFDGAHFTIFYPNEVPALEGVQVLELRCDPSGRLWIEGIDGQLVVYEKGRFRRLDGKDGIPPEQAGKLGESRGGTFWVKGRSDGRFYRYDGKRFRAVAYADVSGTNVDRFEGDATGVRWGVHESDRTMLRFTGNKAEVRRLTAPDGKSRVRAGRLFWLRDGSLGVTSTHGIYVLRNSRWELVRAFARPLTTNESNAILDGIEDWQSNFWISVFGEGLVLSRADGRMSLVSLPDSSSQPFIRALLFGAEGNIWIAGNDGLYRLRRNAFRSQAASLAETRNNAVVSFVEDARGTMWILYQNGWARHSATGWKFTPVPYPKALLWTGVASRDGSVMLGYSTGPNSQQGYVDKVYSTGRSERLGPLGGRPLVMLEPHQGELWVGADPGLWRWKQGRFTRIRIPNCPGDYAVHGLAEDRQGRILVGASGRGLYRRNENGGWERLTGTSDAEGVAMYGICVDDEGTIWVATDSSLARWHDGEWYSYVGVHSALPALARSVICDGLDGLWISSEFGVARLDLNALTAIAAGQDATLGSVWFDRSDGLPSASCADQQAALYRAADGRIWVGTLKGAAVVDPKEWRRQRERVPAPSVNVEAVLVDDKNLLGPSEQSSRPGVTEMAVPPGARRIEFRYTVVDLTPNRKSRFRYRLQGSDQEWVDAGERQAVVYHQLAPGHYQFQVMAANKYGLWTTAGASVAFFVEPHWWETFWFRIGAGMFVVGLLWFSRSVKLRQLQRERVRREGFSRRLIQSQEDERKRIAGELHDSLGQDLILIKNAANLTLRKFAPAPPVQERLDEMVDLASHALTNARAVTSNLRPPELDRLGLTAALEAMVDQHAENSGIQFEAAIENVDRLWPPEQEINIYRVVQESLNNALKHASPRRIEVAVKRQVSEVNILLKDDGCGFDQEATLASGQRLGMGLTGLEERVRILGGEMQLNSVRGAGTSLHYRIPIPNDGKK